MNRYQITPTGGPAKTGFRRQLKRPLVGLALLAGMVAIGCSQGSYPVDIFYEMHYQQSYKSHEPPRLSAPAGAVPWYPAPKSTSFDTGQHLFAINCSMCHGDGGKGDGPVVRKLTETYGYKPVIDPPDVTDNPVENIVAVLEATTRPFGPDSVMPPFGKLLSDEERLAIAEYIMTLSATASVAPAEKQPTAVNAPIEPVSTDGPLDIGAHEDALELNKDRLEIAADSRVVLAFNRDFSINHDDWVLVQTGQKLVGATRGATAGPDVMAKVRFPDSGATGEWGIAAPHPGTYQSTRGLSGKLVLLPVGFCTLPGQMS